MRLFIAVNLNEEIRDYLSEAIEKVKRCSAGGTFSRRENLHLTLVFLGEVSEGLLGAVKSAMNRINEKPFLLSIEGFGKFRRRGGDIHWAGVSGNDALFLIQKLLSTELKKAGFSLEDREYSPHLTLGREIRIPDTSMDPYGSLADGKREMTVSKISLMKSERINGRLVYTEIYERILQGGINE